VLYVSPLKALAADVERNLRAPLAGIAQTADARGEAYLTPAIAIRTGDTPQVERARFRREPADILITTPESLYLLLTSNAREALRSVDTIIIDEIHALVPTKRGAHLALSIERLAAICARPGRRPPATNRPVRHAAAARRGRAVSRGHATVGRRRQAFERAKARRAGRHQGRADRGGRRRRVSLPLAARCGTGPSPSSTQAARSP